ncbi:tetratricopeptide repeat protein [Sphingomonas ginkgonis]|uniref:Tetratricopeptide repeat protein n=1 Tax=Sphingomonas ginkgonis TaxID=2315330 RepID=A0A429VAM4_9SPHN|nr:tetratricopeptide repeat protein [Sphingomonas ginkgonis]RST31040.1 tetratricopeptide repeat protein [Sphingomonas ginkgonis]
MLLSGAAASPATARTLVRPPLGSALSGYVAARAASLTGDHGEAARRYVALLALDPGNAMLARDAISENIRAGMPEQALRLAAQRPLASLGADARLLLVTDALKRGDGARALELLRYKDGEIELGFLAPLIGAWQQAERGDAGAIQTLAAVPPASAAAPLLAEHRALILLKLGRGGEADPFARRAIAAGGGREDRVRLAMAQGFARLRDQPRAQEMLGGNDQLLARARAQLASGRLDSVAVHTSARGFAQILAALSLALNGGESRSLALSLAQLARFADPADGELPVLTGLLLDADGQTDAALAAFRAVPASDLFASEARDAAVRSLIRSDRTREALALADPAARARDASADDWSRLGDVYAAMNRNGDAAGAYGRAVALVAAGGPGPAEWQLRLLQGSSLDQAGQWPAGRATLEQALRQSPDQPLLLNYLGYAKLEKGEQLEEAESLIRRASTLAPQDASITDSLGWMQFKRGRVNEAIATLEKAAAADPSQSEIREHLGDALFTAGRRYEARYAWAAALVTAESKDAGRIRAKLDAGLTGATVAP